MAIRDTQLTLLADGGAELIDLEDETTLWASDTDEDFAEEFPDILDENDVEHLLDYLEEREELKLTPRELEVMEIITEPLEGEDDPDDDDDEDDDDDVDWRRDDEDVIDGEVVES